MGLGMKNLNIAGVHWKIRFLGGGGGGRFTKYQYTEGNFLRRGWGRLGQFADLRGEFFRGGGGGWYANAHYVVVLRKGSGK